ncbi:MAG: sulfatase-like hydrolase/transferase [Verrucomicrobia bacterium]|nr:sulfatase-like hydrolase/transferase [Verrucomicrobiota bacterium]
MRHFLVALVLALSAVAADSKRPNILFILADDLGWGDLSCYGNTFLKTPNLDRLAAQGKLFTNFYVAGSVCSPSRCGFFTSNYPARQRIHGHFATPELNASRGMSQFLDPKVPNVAATLRAAGYATAHVGKWHLGNGSGGPPIADYGFDFVGSGEGPAGANIVKGDPYYRAKSTAIFVDEALKFIQGRGEKPFYLQLWTLVPHATLNPMPEQMAPFDRFSNPDIPHKSARTIFYASVSDLDQQIGRLLDELTKLGVADNTAIFFSSDNGPEEIFIGNAGHSGVGSPGPFRGRKRSLYEGGVREPFIVRWPGHIPAGVIDDSSIMSGVDFMPTVLELAGVPTPAGWRPDGEDVSDILVGASRSRKEPLMWEWRFNIAGHVNNRSPQLAIRDGDWKLLLNPDRSRIELYDLPRDRMQVDNVAGQHPDIVARLSEKVLAWAQELPPGPRDPGAGLNDYPWPGTTAQKAAPPDGAAKKKGKKKS